MAKSIAVQLPDSHLPYDHPDFNSASSSRSRTANFFPSKDIRSGSRAKEALLTLSHEPFHDSSAHFKSVRLKIEAISPGLIVSGSNKTIRSNSDIRLQTSQLPHAGYYTQPQSTVRTYRSMAELRPRKDVVKAFEKGRNLLNRLEVKTAKEQKRVDSLNYFHTKVEDQRISTHLRNSIRQKERKNTLEDINEKRKIEKKAIKVEQREKEEKFEKEMKETIREVRQKREAMKSLLFVNSLDPRIVPQAKERTLTLSDLQALLTVRQPHRFRFK